MPSWMIQAGHGDGGPWLGTTVRYFNAMGWLWMDNTEVEHQLIARDTYTLDRLYVRLLTNTLNNNLVFRSRINGANGNQLVTIGAGLTGAFEDNVNSDNLVSGNLFNTSGDGTAAGSGLATLSLITYRLTTAVNTTPIMGAFWDVASVSSGSTGYMTLIGAVDDWGIEADAQYTFRVTATLSNMRVYVEANTLNGAANYHLRINGADGNQVITVGAGLTGAFEDAVNTDNIVSGNNVNYDIDSAGSSGNIQWRNIGIKSDSDGRQTGVGYAISAGVASGTTTYLDIEGSPVDVNAAEVNTQSKVRTTLIATNEFLRVIINTLNGATTFTLRKNGADTVLSISVGAGLTGVFEDADSEDFTSIDDLINWRVVTAGSSGSIGYSILAFEQQQYTPVGPGAAPSSSVGSKLIAERLI